MNRTFRSFGAALSLLLGCASTGTAGVVASSAELEAPELQWRSWGEAAFDEAAQQGKYLLVSVQASWCHWCHVMNDETFADPELRRALAEGYVAIRVDSDERPDLAERFRDYAWPATVLLTPDAEFVTAMRGFRNAERMKAILERVRAGEVPPAERELEQVESVEASELRAKAIRMLDRIYDEQAHGWGERQKYPYFTPLEHALYRADVRGEVVWAERARQTADATRELIDPVFGGVYQYSLRRSWDHPHYEKIAAVQADALSAFATMAMREDDPRWREAMHDVVRYLGEFFTHEDGAFYTSQNADLSHDVTGTEYYAMADGERRALGIPRVDRARYADLNGRIIEALVRAHRAGLDTALERAEAAARSMLVLQANDGGFAHGADDEPGALRYLRDQAHMLRALLALYQVTGNDEYLDAAVRAAAWTMDTLRAEQGFHAHTADPAARGVFAERRAPLVENGVLARALLTLDRLKHEERYSDGASHALGVGTPARLRDAGRRGGPFLMALEESAGTYALISVVGPDDEATRALHRAVLGVTSPRALVELSRPGASRYPFPGEAAAYICNADACSRPVFEADAIAAALDAFLESE